MHVATIVGVDAVAFPGDLSFINHGGRVGDRRRRAFPQAQRENGVRVNRSFDREPAQQPREALNQAFVISFDTKERADQVEMPD